MHIVRGKTFTADRAWGATTIAVMNGISTRLHWTDQPYRWHTNDGDEVLDGQVDMYYKLDEREEKVRLGPGDIFYAAEGDAHVAHPVGEARILVIEQEGSV